MHVEDEVAVAEFADLDVEEEEAGFDEEEALRWLFTADETLPGTPIEALCKHRGTEVNRRAQALAF